MPIAGSTGALGRGPDRRLDGTLGLRAISIGGVGTTEPASMSPEPRRVPVDQAFRDAMTAGYAMTEPSLALGSPMHAGEILPEVRVQVALAMLNRHGLVAGATGTGKTKTLQLMAGQLSQAGRALSSSPTSRAT